MTGDHRTATARLLGVLEGLPEAQEVFRRCLAVLASGSEISLAVAGSLASGAVDELSDLDLIALVDEDRDIRRLQRRLFAEIRQDARPLASFTATHLGRPDLAVEYLAVGQRVVKVDLAVQALAEARPLPVEAVIVHDPVRRFARVPIEPPGAAPDLEEIDEKLVGWLWYSHARIGRGEFFQAARSIDFSREHALLPCLLYLHGLPQDGHRRIEQRLSAVELERLTASYPVALERGELCRALHALADYYQELRPALAAKLGRDFRRADVAGMIARIGGAEDTPAPGSTSPPWYVRYYGADYANSVAGLLTPELSAAEVEFILHTTGIAPPAAVADLACGDGRHSRLLAERGFAVTAVDLSANFIARGRALARSPHAPRFHVGDIKYPIKGPYDLLLSLFNSWGFRADREDEEALARWIAELHPGGWLVLDLWNRDSLVRHFQPERRRVVSADLEVRESARFDALSGRLCRAYEYRYAGGRVERYEASFRLYAPAELRTLLSRHGLEVRRLAGSLQGGDYSWDSPRLVCFARKPAEPEGTPWKAHRSLR
ncbi:MAG TPA: class I SAM-dependent methyltransferase [Thermoanaerobaculia bacterium]|nr:class I SAM-dependent methyltransferase [Thermoanaerobaculia bacterium]